MNTKYQNMARQLLVTTITFLCVSYANAADDMCFEKAQSQNQINECAATALKEADKKLNILYQSMQRRLNDSGDKANALIEAQRKWVEFRNLECKFTTTRTVGSSIYPFQLNSCLAELTRTRIIEFENHLACSRTTNEQEGLQCAIPK